MVATGQRATGGVTVSAVAAARSALLARSACRDRDLDLAGDVVHVVERPAVGSQLG